MKDPALRLPVNVWSHWEATTEGRRAFDTSYTVPFCFFADLKFGPQTKMNNKEVFLNIYQNVRK